MTSGDCISTFFLKYPFIFNYMSVGTRRKPAILDPLGLELQAVVSWCAMNQIYILCENSTQFYLLNHVNSQKPFVCFYNFFLSMCTP